MHSRETMLGRLARRTTIASSEHFISCRRVVAHVDGDVEWTLGERPATPERPGAVLLALEDQEPVELTGPEATELASALELRAASLRGEQPRPGRVE